AQVAPFFDSRVVVDKREGDAVVAGATVIRGRLRVSATFTGAERAWLRQTSAAARAFGAPPLVSLARRVVERGAPIAAILVGGAVFASNGSWADVVVSACAAAYVLGASPAVGAAALAHTRGALAAQRRGIVYKSAASFDTA